MRRGRERRFNVEEPTNVRDYDSWRNTAREKRQPISSGREKMARNVGRARNKMAGSLGAGEAAKY